MLADAARGLWENLGTDGKFTWENLGRSEIASLSAARGLLVATAVGIFGVYLARQASLLDPIVAWRSEL
jgi:hypothetical protein